MTDLRRLAATDLAARIRARLVPAVEVVNLRVTAGRSPRLGLAGVRRLSGHDRAEGPLAAVEAGGAAPAHPA